MSKVKSVKKNSIHSLSLNNDMNSEQAIWSRCDSFSSSSSDSTTFSSNGIKRPRFTAIKRLTSEERPTNSKRNRNSSGSSASSNLSCNSEREAKDMPVLMSSGSISTIDNTKFDTLKKLSNISSTSLALQHEVLLSKNLTKSIGINGVLPFRHNLRRNIRKKRCCCDCNTSCTTVVVSRQYKDVGKRTYEEKTVISRTKVKTFVKRETSPPLSENKTSATDAAFESSPDKRDTNKRRRSEIEKLYDSLHEIKWAKNFSPDNILRQLDVRQAASCSIFGKPNKCSKSPDKSVNSFKNKCSPDKSTLQRSSKISKINLQKPHSNNFYNKRYSTRYSSRLSKHDSLVDVNINSPKLKKINVSNQASVDCNSKFKTCPTSSEDFSSDNKLNEMSKNSYNPIKRENSSKTVDIFPKKFLSFGLKSGCVESFENVNDCTFFNMSEEGIHTLDACFHEVGAEVVVSTCYESDCKLPILTSVDEIHTETSTTSNDNPPILEPLLSPKKLSLDVEIDEKACFQEVNAEVIVSTCKTDFNLPLLTPIKEIKLNTAAYDDNPPTLEPSFSESLLESKTLSDILPEVKIMSDKKEPLKIICDKATLHPQITTSFLKSNSILEDDFSLFKSCDTENIKFINCFQGNKMEELDIVGIETKFYLPQLGPNEIASLKKESFDLDQELSAMESCLEAVEENVSLFNERKIIKFEENKFEASTKVCSLNNKIGSYNTMSFRPKVNLNNKRASKSLVVAAGKRILKKYLKLAHSKLKKINSPNCLKVSNNSYKCLTSFSNISNNCALTLSNQSVSRFSKQHKNFPDISTNCLEKSLPFKSPLKIIDSGIKRKSSKNSSLKMCNQISKSTNVDYSNGSTVIQSFNRKLSFKKSPEKITFNQISESFFYHSEKEASNFSSLNSKGRKISNIHNKQHLDDGPGVSGYMKILANSKKKDSSETINVPPEVFSCPYQTIKVSRGSSYVQIVLKITEGKSIFLTQESLMELKEAIYKASHDSDCKLLILNGFGKTFCLGLDLVPIVGSCKNQVVGDLSIAVK